jgi:hypothetical protein
MHVYNAVELAVLPIITVVLIVERKIRTVVESVLSTKFERKSRNHRAAEVLHV